MKRSAHGLVWLLPLLLFVGLGGIVLPGGPMRSAVAGDDGGNGGGPPGKPDGGDNGKDGGDDDGGDFFDSPTSFTAEQVDHAIRKGLDWLKKAQKDDGSWGNISGGKPYGGKEQQGSMYPHPAGPTALAVYTMLKCKESDREPHVRKGFEYLKKHYEKPAGSYETSILLLAVLATADPYKTSRAAQKNEEKLKLGGAERRWAQKLHDYLIEKRKGLGWRYNVTGNSGATPGGDQDLSSTQLSTLALFAADRLHISTKPEVWEDILKFSLAQQDDDGAEVVTKDPLSGKEIHRKARGFAYIKGQPDPEEGQAVGSMTACGIANVMMARHALMEGGKKRDVWDARADAQKVQQSVEDGMAWLEENWSPFQNPKKNHSNIYHLYWLYSVERAMDLIGGEKIGNHLWYSEMGQQLLNHQNEDGSWDTKTTLEPRAVLDTCFALLFLKRATHGQIRFPSITGGSDEEPPTDNR